jgi:hypothetical protein
MLIFFGFRSHVDWLTPPTRPQDIIIIIIIVVVVVVVVVFTAVKSRVGLLLLSNNIRVFKSRTTGWVGHEARNE